jgi:hypothetical protein
MLLLEKALVHSASAPRRRPTTTPWESLFTLGPSRTTGAVQGIINPFAIK